MASLPKSIIKKYGISKKAWSVYRGQGQASRSTRKMARKRYARRGARRYSRSSSTGMGVFIPPAIYGALRDPIANNSMVKSLTSKLPFGQYNDEVGNFALSWAVAKWVPNPLARSVATDGMKFEVANVSRNATAGMLGGTTSSSSSATGISFY